jgi:2-polyprenyl-6-methoxyphenol hydroxylase-like FAD-dependent oxidoreductase
MGSATSTPNAVPWKTRVLIIGGGPVGLTASALLSQQGISNVVVERRNETQRGHFLSHGRLPEDPRAEAGALGS